MPWYVIYMAPPIEFKEGSLPVHGITRPMKSEVASLLKADELGRANVVIGNIYSKLEDSRDVLLDYLSAERELLKEYVSSKN